MLRLSFCGRKEGRIKVRKVIPKCTCGLCRTLHAKVKRRSVNQTTSCSGTGHCAENFERGRRGDTPLPAVSRSLNRSPDAAILSTTPASTHLCGRLADTAALPPAPRTCRSMVALRSFCESCAENGTSSVLPSPFLAILLLFACLIPASPCPSWSYCCTYLTVTDKHERSGRGTHPDVVGAERNLQRELKSASRAPIKNMSQNQLVVWVVLYGDATEGTRVLEVRSEDVEW